MIGFTCLFPYVFLIVLTDVDVRMHLNHDMNDLDRFPVFLSMGLGVFPMKLYNSLLG